MSELAAMCDADLLVLATDDQEWPPAFSVTLKQQVPQFHVAHGKIIYGNPHVLLPSGYAAQKWG